MHKCHVGITCKHGKDNRDFEMCYVLSQISFFFFTTFAVFAIPTINFTVIFFCWKLHLPSYNHDGSSGWLNVIYGA
jgi:hypothetical protein